MHFVALQHGRHNRFHEAGPLYTNIQNESKSFKERNGSGLPYPTLAFTEDSGMHWGVT